MHKIIHSFFIHKFPESGRIYCYTDSLDILIFPPTSLSIPIWYSHYGTYMTAYKDPQPNNQKLDKVILVHVPWHCKLMVFVVIVINLYLRSSHIPLIGDFYCRKIDTDI